MAFPLRFLLADRLLLIPVEFNVCYCGWCYYNRKLQNEY